MRMRRTGFTGAASLLMVDIHSHILPGWDDGAKSMEDSLEMLRIAVESGTTDIVATPHANSEFPFNPEVVNGLFAQLQQAAGGMIRLHLGCDFHVHFENVQEALANPAKFTINRGPYLMVELPDVMNFQVIREILMRLRDVGVNPVITHPERNMQLQTKPDELQKWVQDGCLMQITGQSLLGRFGNSALQCCNQLLKEDLVHFVASDAHDTKDRTPKLNEAYHLIESRYGKRRAERLFRLNPAAVVAGQPLYIDDRSEPRQGKSWWKFWR